MDGVEGAAEESDVHFRYALSDFLGIAPVSVVV
jgi:hypothetical protein